MLEKPNSDGTVRPVGMILDIEKNQSKLRKTMFVSLNACW